MDWAKALDDIESIKADISLETILTDPSYFNHTVASPMQRALCRVIDGRPLGDLADDPDIKEALGDCSQMVGIRPFETAICAGIRSGKSLLNAAVMVHACMTVDISHLRPGEVPRCSIVSVDKKSARETLNHLVGSCQRSPILQKYIEQGRDGVYYFTQPQNGRKIEISVVANRREGSSLVSAWNVCVVFDEAARMADSSEGVVNLEDARKAVLGRLLPNGRIMYTSSPTSPNGLFYLLITENHKKPTKHVFAAVCRGPAMNPARWTPERVAEVKAQDVDVWVTDVEGRFASPEGSMFALSSIDRCTRHSPMELPYEKGCHYKAAIDPATRANGWTLVISTRKGEKRIVAKIAEWRGNKERPLNTLEVMPEVARICLSYGITSIESDQYLLDVLRDVAATCGISLYCRRLAPDQKWKLALETQARLNAGHLEIPYDPTLRSDMIRAKKVPLQSGGFTVSLPHTASDSRHCDYVPALILSIGAWIEDQTPLIQELTDQTKVASIMKEERLTAVKSQQHRIKRNRLFNRVK